MTGTILRCIDPNYTKKDIGCIICGTVGRTNKSLFEVQLKCNHKAEVPICRRCTGEGAARRGFIELPYLQPTHYHVKGYQGKTFWDYSDTLKWIKDFWQSPEPVEETPGEYVLTLPQPVMKFFRCDGSTPKTT